MAPVDDSAPAGRPAVSVILPFAGSDEEAEEAVGMLAQIALQAGDEIILVDNSGRDPGVQAGAPVQVVRAWREASSYYARNEGTAVARNPWLLFLDADCQAPPDLIERYFSAPIADDIGAVIGEVHGSPQQDALVSRYARSRGHLGQEVHWRSPFRPWGVTANLLVRREAWASVGGFQEGIRSAGDTEFSWRLQDAGWRLDYRPEAAVAHEHRDSIRRLARQAARYAAGRAWIMRRYPGSFPRPTLVPRLARCAAGVVVWTATGQFERATFKALDAVYIVSEWSSFWLMPNRGATGRAPQATTGVVAGAFPGIGDDAVLPPGAHVEALSRPVRVDREAARRLGVSYMEDDGGLDRAIGLSWLLVRGGRGVRSAMRRDFRAVLEVAPAVRRMHQAGVRSAQPLSQDSTEPDVALLNELLRALPR